MPPASRPTRILLVLAMCLHLTDGASLMSNSKIRLAWVWACLPTGSHKWVRNNSLSNIISDRLSHHSYPCARLLLATCLVLLILAFWLEKPEGKENGGAQWASGSS